MNNNKNEAPRRDRPSNLPISSRRAERTVGLEVPASSSSVRERRGGGSLSPRYDDEEAAAASVSTRSIRKSMSSSRLPVEVLTADVPEAKSPYNGLTHGVRRMVPAELACKMGCRGVRCKFDRSDCWEQDQMAIDGLYSHW